MNHSVQQVQNFMGLPCLKKPTLFVERIGNAVTAKDFGKDFTFGSFPKENTDLMFFERRTLVFFSIMPKNFSFQQVFHFLGNGFSKFSFRFSAVGLKESLEQFVAELSGYFRTCFTRDGFQEVIFTTTIGSFGPIQSNHHFFWKRVTFFPFQFLKLSSADPEVWLDFQKMDGTSVFMRILEQDFRISTHHLGVSNTFGALKPVGVLENPVQSIDQSGSGAEVSFQTQPFCIFSGKHRIPCFQVGEDLSTPKTIDRLLWISNQHQSVGSTFQEEVLEDRPLSWVGILKLINDGGFIL